MRCATIGWMCLEMFQGADIWTGELRSSSQISFVGEVMSFVNSDMATVRRANKRSNATYTEMRAEEVAKQNEAYALLYPNWMTTLADVPIFSYRQMMYNNRTVGLGSLTVRRPAVAEQADALAGLLTFKNVEALIANQQLSKEVAREWGALLTHRKRSVPFNLLYHGLPKAGENPETPPVPRTDKLYVLGLLFYSEEEVLHFKAWYESGSTETKRATFELDLLYPLLEYYARFREEYPNLRNIDFGRGSQTGRKPGPEDRFVRKVPEADLEWAPWPNCRLDDQFKEAAEEVEDDEEAEGPKVKGYTPSGAPVFN